jgi:hypothetical protein
MATSTSVASSDTTGVLKEKDADTSRAIVSQAPSVNGDAVDAEPKVKVEDTDTSHSATEAEEEYPKGIRLLFISLALCLAVLLVALVSWPVIPYYLVLAFVFTKLRREKHRSELPTREAPMRLNHIWFCIFCLTR